MNNILKKELENFYDQEVWGNYTLDEYLEEKSKLYPQNLAIIDGDIKITYETLTKVIKNYANRMVSDGIKEGDTVIVQLPNCLEFVFVIFALFKIGAKPVLTLANHRKLEVKGVIKNSQAVAYIAKSNYLGFSYENFIREIESEMNYKIKKYILGDTNEYKNFYNLKRNDYFYQQEFIHSINHYKDTALLLLSGGTTGIPKLIPRRHCDYIYVAEQSAKRCLLDENTIYLASLSMAHNFPLGCPGIIGTFSVGGTVIICNVTSPDEIFPLIEDNSVTHTALVPSVAKMCIDFYKNNPDYNISSLKLIQIGGSLLDSYTGKEIVETLKCTLQQVYGIAEGLICMTSPKDEDEIIYETQGTPISEYDEVKIVDENGNEVAEGEFGELYVRGPYTIYGYYNAPNIKCVDDNMYFMTGDKVCKYKNGRYKIVGRIKEMINKSGEKILPSEIENLLLTHNHIDDVKVIGIEDEIVGEKICVCLKNETNLNIIELRTYLKNHGLAEYKLPDCIKTVKEWPLTSFGKIDIKKLKTMI